MQEIFQEQMDKINFISENTYYENTDSLEEVKKRHIHKVLAQCNGNQTLAAKRLGISRTHLWRIINQDKK